MRRRIRLLQRVTACTAALSFAAAAVACAKDPVSPGDWLRRHTPPAPPSPPTVQPPFVGFANFFRTTQVGDSVYVIGYQLNGFGRLWLFRVVDVADDCEECDNWEEYAMGDYTLMGSTIVLRLSRLGPQAVPLAGVYEVHGVLRGDTLRLAYPDSMQRMSPMFSSGDYVVGQRRDFP
jgi:hypothetical protein